LTKTQKRRLQCERREELSKGKNSGQSGDQQQPDPKGKGPSTDANMVFMLPMEFLAPSNDDEEFEFSDQISLIIASVVSSIQTSTAPPQGNVLSMKLLPIDLFFHFIIISVNLSADIVSSAIPADQPVVPSASTS